MTNPREYSQPVVTQLGAHEDLPNSNGMTPSIVSPSQELRDNIQKQISDAPGIMRNREGIASGGEAADAMFANNTSAISRSLSSRATKAFALGQSTNQLQGTLKNVNRSRMALGDVGNKMQQLQSLRRHNLMGQLRFADEIANYNDKLDAAKLGALGSIIGGIAKGGAKAFTGGSL